MAAIMDEKPKRKRRKGFLASAAELFVERVVSRLGRYDRATPTGPVGEGVTALRAGSVNVWVVDGDDGRIAIDAGPPGRALPRAFREAGIRPSEITHVLLTHSDWDHTGALPLYGRARVFLPRLEEPLVTGERARVRWTYHNPPLPCPVELVDDGQILSLGSRRIRVVSTPGHTPGHACYVVDEALLFAGDTLTLVHDRVRVFLPLFNWHTSRLRDSLRRLARDPALESLRLLCTAHTGFSRRPAEAFARWKDGP